LRQNFKTGFEPETRRDISKRNPEVGSDRLKKLANRRIKQEGNEMQCLCIEEDGQMGLVTR